jgi:iron complex outermembrane recepter protein
VLRRCIRALLSSVVTGSLLLGPANLVAAEAQRTFDIRSTELSRALLVFSQQSDLVVVAAADLVADRPAPVVSGTMTAEEAISRLLRGSGLQYVKDKDGTIRIVRAGAPIPGEATPVSRNDTQGPELEEIVVVGSHIQGAGSTRMLPVTRSAC